MKIEFRTHDDKRKLQSEWSLFPVIPPVGSFVQIKPTGSGVVVSSTYNYRIKTIFVFVELVSGDQEDATHDS